MDETREYQVKVVADNIRRLRKSAGVSQAELAFRAEISSVAMYESGKRYPSPEHMAKLAKALGVSVSTLTSDPSGERPAPESPHGESKDALIGRLVALLPSLDEAQIRTFLRTAEASQPAVTDHSVSPRKVR